MPSSSVRKRALMAGVSHLQGMNAIYFTEQVNAPPPKGEGGGFGLRLEAALWRLKPQFTFHPPP